MRKTICLILSFTLIFNVFVITSFANKTSASFSIDNYTLNDLRNMTTKERLDCLNNFEKTYMPEVA